MTRGKQAESSQIDQEQFLRGKAAVGFAGQVCGQQARRFGKSFDESKILIFGGKLLLLAIHDSEVHRKS